MKSNNPVFSRSEDFNNPSTWGTGSPEQPTTAELMTIDSVVQKTSITLVVVVAFAFATWMWAGNPSSWGEGRIAQIAMVSAIGAGGAFVLSLVNSFRRAISPPLVLAFAAFEGVALGAISMFFESQYPGIVTNVVLGTLAAFAGTLAAYKYFEIKLSTKFKLGVIAVMFGMVGLSLLSLALSFFGISTGLFGSGPLGVLFAAVGLVLGVFMLLMDFDFIENGIAAGIDERQSWVAAFGITVSLVWIYTNLLRLLAIFSSN